MAIAMFSLIVFSLVMMATMNENYTALFLGDEAAAGWDVRVDTAMANPVSDFEGTLQQNGIDTSGFTAIGTVTTPNPYASRLRMAGDSEWKPYEVRGMNQSFIEDSRPDVRAARRGIRQRHGDHPGAADAAERGGGRCLRPVR